MPLRFPVTVLAKAAIVLTIVVASGRAVYGQTLVVNKYVCSADSFAADPPSGDATSAQCKTITSANLNEDVTYYIVITNLKTPTTGITLTDTLPAFFLAKQVVCKGFSGGSCGPPATLSGRNLVLSGLTVPVDDGTVPQRGVVIAVLGSFFRSGNNEDFINTAKGTPHTAPAAGDPNTNVAPKPITINYADPKWDLGVEKEMTPKGTTGFHIKITVKNNSPEKVFVDRLIYLQDRLKISTSPIPFLKYTVSNYTCGPNPSDPGCPNLPTGSSSGSLDTNNIFTYLPALFWQGPALQPAYLAPNSSVTIEFDIVFEPTCGRGVVELINEAYLVLQQNGGEINDTNPNNDHPTVPACPTGTNPCPTIKLNYEGPACPIGSKTVIQPSDPTSVQWWNGVNDEVVYQITVTNPAGSAMTLRDEITKALGTPPFNWQITTGPSCNPSNACATPTVLNSSGSAFDTTPQLLFSLPVTGSTVVTFGIRFTPIEKCQTTTGNRFITNTATSLLAGNVVSRSPVNIQMVPLPPCELEVTKAVTSGNTAVVFGTPITYEVTYTNKSTTQPVTIRTLRDAVTIDGNFGAGIPIDVDPASTCVASWGPTFAPTSTTANFQTRGWSGNPVANLASLSTPVTFPAGGSIKCTIKFTPKEPSSCQPSGSPKLVNAAFFDTEVFPLFGAVQPPFYKEVALPLPTCRTITIQKNTDNNVAVPGANRTFTITIHNSGSSAATGIQFEDPMPAGFVIQSVTCSRLPGNTPCTTLPTWGSNQILTAPLDSIPAGGDIVITVVVKAPAVGGSYKNTASIKFVNQGNVYNSGGNTSNPAQVQVQTPALTKAFDPANAAPGDQVTLVFTITNPTGRPVTEVRFTDNLPTGLEIVRIDNGGTTCKGNLQAPVGGSSISFTGGTIDQGSCQIRVVVLVKGCSVVNRWSEKPEESNITNVNNLDPSGVNATLTVSPCPPPTGYVQICKVSSTTNPVTGSFQFSLSSGTGNPVPVTVPVGGCSSPLAVPPGNVTVTEGAVPGVGIGSVTASGYNSATGAQEDRLVSTNAVTRTAVVKVVGGDIATATVVQVTNGTLPMGYVEVCKEAAPGVSLTGLFSFTVEGATSNPYSVPPGACSGPIRVQSGSVTVTELPRAGFQLVDVSTVPADRVISKNIPGSSATIMVPGGDVSTETVVRFVNGVGPGQLKICKIAGPGVAEGQTFTISANGVTNTVPAGPAASGGYCVLDGTFPVGTVVTVQESIPAGGQVSNIAVNPPDRAASAPDLTRGLAQVTIGSGFTEVTFTNTATAPPPAAQLTICKVAGQGVAVGTNFTFVVTGAAGNQQRYTIQAGPAAQGGYCTVDRTFPIGSSVTVSELAQAGSAVSSIKVEPTSRGGAVNLATGSVGVTLGVGVNLVTYTNAGPLTVITSRLSVGAALAASGGVAPYYWQIVGGPLGAHLNPFTGEISGLGELRQGPLVVQVMDSSWPPQLVTAEFVAGDRIGGRGGLVRSR